MKRAILTAVSLVLVAGGAAACGGSPKDASVEDFCTAATDAQGVDDAKGIKDWAEKMDETGTPSDIPDDARDGFELYIKTAKKLDDDASDEELNDADKDFSDKDNDNIEAYNKYVTETCADQIKEQMEGN
jgi:hypothetical protein